jgi:hypothetical protein
MTRSLSLGGLLSALAASAALAGCGASAQSTTTSTPGLTVVPRSTSVGPSGRQPTGQGQSLAKPKTLEEKREYDANEGRCEDDGGSVRNVGTIDAYCAFPTRSDDFHLIETSHQKAPAGEEE